MFSFGQIFLLSIFLVLAQGLSLGDHQNGEIVIGKEPGKLENSTTFTIEGRNYFVSGHKLNWDKAKRSCWNMGMQLVAIESLEENNAILREVSGDRSAFWTSGTDQGQEGYFVWDTTGQSVGFSYWAHGEPNNFFGNEHCIKMKSSSHQWNDNACWDSEKYICEQL
ncbi:lectin subunit alpha-like [Neocloeon triangulifer]|uniref:lectin subunit alpha-like n=1 Tax=Neocloeon triangulifer TaxID=2078957 RepID=UPI00286F4856|nr:lectin subunit alpha-like [Neocloeon triangulifer]